MLNYSMRNFVVVGVAVAFGCGGRAAVSTSEPGAGSGGAPAASIGGDSSARASGRGEPGGSGGTQPSAGAPTGPVGGGPSEPTCDELYSRADEYLAAARSCDAPSNDLQCTGVVVGPCGCMVPVQKSDSYLTQLYLGAQQAIRGRMCQRDCPSVGCPIETSSQCGAPSGPYRVSQCEFRP